MRAGTALLAAPALISRANAAEPIVKVGFVSPETGPLAPFGAADSFVLRQVNEVLKHGLKIGGSTYEVRILKRDSESSRSRASSVASDLILGEKVNLITASSTSATVVPVAAQAELNGVPCVTTNAPWQSYFFGLHGNPKAGFGWTYHFFWGLEQVIHAYLALWKQVTTNNIVGAMFGNDATGNAWANPQTGFPAALPKAGYKLIQPGRYQDGSTDYSAQIRAFKRANVEIVVGNMLPPDFATFWTQCAQQGFRPKVVTIGKAILFPSAIEALGSRANNLSCEIWWGPTFPFKSGLTGQTSAELCAAYTKATGRTWTQPIGYQHALFEVATNVLKRTKNPDDPKSILNAITSTDYNSIVGHVQWTGKPVKNVAVTPLVAGQWRVKPKASPDILVCEDSTAPKIPMGGKFKLL